MNLDVDESPNRTRISQYLFVSIYFFFPILTVFKFKLQAVFDYFAADAFYYLSVAKNSEKLWNSADGVTHTNGFHPLWQNLLNLINWLTRPSDSGFIWISFWLSFFFVVIGYIFICNAGRKITNSSVPLILMFPGLVYICSYQSTTVEYGITNIYQPFSFINGMESPLTIFLFGGLFVYLQRTSSNGVTNYFLLGGAIALLISSRLDDIFLLVGFSGYIIVYEKRFILKKLIQLSIPVAGVLSTLFLYHLMTNQSIMPVSGQIKGTDTGEFPSNFTTIKNLLLPGKALEAVNTRAYGLFIPLLLSLGFLTILGIFRTKRFHHQETEVREIKSLQIFFFPFSVYVILKSLYIFKNFYLIETGYWYYIGPVICVNFLAVLLIGKFISQNVIQKTFLILVVSLVQIFNLSFVYHKLQTDNASYVVFTNRSELQNKLDELFGKNVKFIDGTDGIYSYIFDQPSQSARGFTTNKEGYEAFKSGGYPGYYSHLLSNGYNVLVGLNTYTHPVPSSVHVQTVFTDPVTGTVFSRLNEAHTKDKSELSK